MPMLKSDDAGPGDRTRRPRRRRRTAAGLRPAAGGRCASARRRWPTRIAISRARSSARASCRFVTFAQAMSSTPNTAPSIVNSVAMTSPPMNSSMYDLTSAVMSLFSACWIRSCAAIARHRRRTPAACDDARLQPADDFEGRSLPALRRQRELQGLPQVLGHGKRELRRHDADDFRRNAVDAEDPADRRGVLLELRLPDPMTDDHHRRRAGLSRPLR